MYRLKIKLNRLYLKDLELNIIDVLLNLKFKKKNCLLINMSLINSFLFIDNITLDNLLIILKFFKSNNGSKIIKNIQIFTNKHFKQNDYLQEIYQNNKDFKCSYESSSDDEFFT